MPYTKKISTHAPGLILLVLDDSGSMSEPLPGTQDAKHEWVNRLTGLTLQELLQRCTEIRDGVAVVKPRYHFFPIPYGSTPQAWGPAEIDIQAILQRCAQNGNSLGLGGSRPGWQSAIVLAVGCYRVVTEAKGNGRPVAEVRLGTARSDVPSVAPSERRTLR